MPQKLITVVTCDKYQYQDEGGGHRSGENGLRANAVRNTWYKTWLARYSDQIDLKFFVGRCDRKPLENEIILDCDDSYYGLPDKVRKTNIWALEQGYDELTKVDDDVVLWIGRLLDSPLTADYRGYEIESDIKYASGTCYQLSRRAMEHVARAPIPEGEWREDRHVGRVLLNAGISLTNDSRFLCCSCDDCLRKYAHDSLISIHTTSPKQMYSLLEQQ